MLNSWDQVLYFMTGGFEATQGQVAVPPVVENFLVQTGLVQPDRRTGVLEPTNTGFEFMLRDIHEQVWTYVFETIQRNREHAQELLSFLFALSYCEVGQDYPVSELSTVQQMMMREFCELGILYMRKPGSRRFYPTPLAVNLMFGAEPAARQAGHVAVQRMPTRKRMSIIVQTNFQVIAYVTSKLHLGMLSLFVNIKIRLPNAAIGVLTRSSVKDAMRMGITSEQILNFLRMHADPLVWNKASVLPDNVMDQIVIWENESRRVHAQPGILIDDRQVVERNPDKRNEFNTMHELVKSAGMCLWEDVARCMMVVSEEGAKQLEQLRRSTA
jgi:transcription initiation factor TFIIH subunit 4